MNKRKWMFCLLAVLLLFLSNFALFSFSQEDVIRIETDLIGFEVTVTDENGFPVKGLQSKDFRIFENGVQRKLDFFEPLRKEDEAKRPLAIVFALDTSGSITIEEMMKLRDAMQQFTNRLADYNSYFAVMAFGMEVKTLQGFTNKPEKLQKTFERLLRDSPGLSTHAYDAVDDAVRLIKKKAPQTNKNRLLKRVVILITDGFPVGDTVKPETVIERANAAETSIYSVILPSYSRLQGTRKPLPTPIEISGLMEKNRRRFVLRQRKEFRTAFFVRLKRTLPPHIT